MWIVRLALRRPYTFVVMGLVIVLLQRGGERRAKRVRSTAKFDARMILSDS